MSQRVVLSPVLGMFLFLGLVACGDVKDPVGANFDRSDSRVTTSQLGLAERTSRTTCAVHDARNNEVKLLSVGLIAPELVASIRRAYEAPAKRYALLREVRALRHEDASSVSVSCIVPYGQAGKELLAAAVRHAQRDGPLVSDVVPRSDSKESSASQALFEALRVQPNSSTGQELGSISTKLVPAVASNAAFRTAAGRVTAVGIGGIFVINTSALLNYGAGAGIDAEYKADLTSGDFCAEVEAAAIAMTEAAADLANELASHNEEWASVDSLLETARCECVVGTVTLPGECFDFWIQSANAGMLAGDARGPDSLAMLANSRAQINFDPTDASKTYIRVNTTKRTGLVKTVETAPLPVLSSPGGFGESWVVSTQVSDSTIEIQWNLVNSACPDVTMLCVAINGTTRVTRLATGGVAFNIDRDAFPSLGYYSRSGTVGCSFTERFVSQPRKLPFDLDFLNLLPFMPREIIDGRRPDVDNPCSISEV